MIEVYRLRSHGMVKIATINDDASVDGASQFASTIRYKFEQMRARGFDPANHLKGIYDRLVANWQHNGYYHIEWLQ